MSSDTPKLLIVDDHEPNIRLYRAVLKDLGADIDSCSSGEQALERCAQHEYAMVLLDVHLAGMSGFDVALRLREADPAVTTPIVFVSAVYTHEDDAFRGYRLGAVDYLLSPVVPVILRAKAAAFIRLYRLRQETQAQHFAMERAFRELRAAHTELEHFSWSVSHDLRTPLSQMLGFADLIRMRSAQQLDPVGLGYLDKLVASGRRMNALIDDLLALAGMARAELKPQPVDLSALAREVSRELSAAQPKRPVDWALADDLRALGDAGMLRAALSNLLGNAMKYSAHRDDARIEFGRASDEEQREGRPVFFVADNGAGFDAEAAGERLFRPFQRFHTNASFEGTGIGLAIVQRVVARHGGSIWAQSRPGQGARFFFTLPEPQRRSSQFAALA
ncbi:MAG TPA: ATP-binding protein [Methylibium sp.]|uniref:sensor histidine kinase n=1 Tax=Methylibium sp. TaxID=2067992 RepID=UPI002DB6DE83|nr:ATP-binding protein [Methylibium sp.]HEU4459451.1 ATP-binding protein [Methylibium sp.]